MALESGQLLLHYRLVDQIGEGGMGEVWRATDTDLDREVALKFLPTAFAEDLDRQTRFEREAKLLASFNHPSIAAIYGLHTSEDLRFLAMELVPGEDLSQVVQRGPLPVDETVRLALQVADALELAHENNVVHRDLKPANILWTPDKKAKVLDFGLAKALEAGTPAQDPHQSPTVTSARTQAGTILGSAAYMSPEQARGETVDQRADIWAFGCVLFELLTGRRAFPGDTISDTLVSLLSHEPEWSALPRRTPATVCGLLRRCLTKDPRRRLRDIGEARIVFEDVIAGKADDSAETSVQTASAFGRRAVAVAIVVGLVMFGAGYLLRSSGAGSSDGQINPDVRVQRLTFSEGLAQEPALSPDGNYLAYTTDARGNLDIKVLPLAGGNSKWVVDHPADDAQPRWSPDGSRLAFVSARDRGGSLTSVGGLGALSRLIQGNGGDIYLMPALGGAVTKLANRALYPTWAPDGSALAFMSDRADQWDIWKISSAGGDPVQLTDDVSIDYQPAWSPDGDWIVFCSQNPLGLRAVSAGGEQTFNLFEGSVLSPAWSPDGRWIYFSCDRASTPGNMNLWRIPFDPGADPVRHPHRVTVGDGSEVGVDVSADGTRLAYSELTDAPDIWSWDPATGEVGPVATLDGDEDFPHLAPDGRRLAFASDRGGTERIWALDLADRSLLQLETSLPATSPRWSPDGSQLVFIEEGEGGLSVVVQRWGDAKARTIASGLDAATRPEWSPDGQSILVGASAGIRIYPVEGGEYRVLDGVEGSFPTWSPDGLQIAYQREVRGGVREIWAVAAAGGEPRLIAGGDIEYSHPHWSPVHPDQILVIVNHNELAVLSVSSGEIESRTSLASTRVLVDYPCWSFDGRRAYFSLSRAVGDIFTIEGL